MQFACFCSTPDWPDFDSRTYNTSKGPKFVAELSLFVIHPLLYSFGIQFFSMLRMWHSMEPVITGSEVMIARCRTVLQFPILFSIIMGFQHEERFFRTVSHFSNSHPYLSLGDIFEYHYTVSTKLLSCILFDHEPPDMFQHIAQFFYLRLCFNPTSSVHRLACTLSDNNSMTPWPYTAFEHWCKCCWPKQNYCNIWKCRQQNQNSKFLSIPCSLVQFCVILFAS